MSVGSPDSNPRTQTIAEVELDRIRRNVHDGTGAKRLLKMLCAAIVCCVGFLCAYRRLGVVLQKEIRPLSVTQGLAFLHYVENVAVPGLKPFP